MSYIILRNRAVSSAIAACALIAATTTYAQPAEDTFVFTSKTDSRVLVGSDGTGQNPYSGSYITGMTKATFANSSTKAAKFTCVSMIQPPNGKIFDLHMLCDATDSDGAYSATMGCTIIDAAAANFSCIGGLYGKSGAYNGRRGTLTNHAVGDTATGTGQWYR
jgi:hypothetical protein